MVLKYFAVLSAVPMPSRWIIRPSGVFFDCTPASNWAPAASMYFGTACTRLITSAHSSAVP